jgi:AcrR family transcriptional regulator
MNTAAALTPLKRARRTKILDAAETLFATQGHRATTMEAIAVAAGMSKVTVYGYFKDKDEVFTAVAERLVERLRVAFTEALERPGTLAARIFAALLAKHAIVFGLVRNSPFSSELFAVRDRIAAPLFDRLDDDLKATLSKCLQEQGISEPEADLRAEVLFNAGRGIADGAQSLDRTRSGLEMLVKALV